MTQDPAPDRAHDASEHPTSAASPRSAETVAPDGRPVPAAAGRHPADLRAPGQDRPDEGDVLDALDAALRAAVARSYAGDRTAEPRVRAAVHAVTDAMRADGVDVVTALRTVKAQVAERGVPHGRLFDDVVRWCIARYYEGAPPPAPLPSAPGRGAPDPGLQQARPT
jgi:hypothetical protein